MGNKLEKATDEKKEKYKLFPKHPNAQQHLDEAQRIWDENKSIWTEQIKGKELEITGIPKPLTIEDAWKQFNDYSIPFWLEAHKSLHLNNSGGKWVKTAVEDELNSINEFIERVNKLKKAKKLKYQDAVKAVSGRWGYHGLDSSLSREYSFLRWIGEYYDSCAIDQFPTEEDIKVYVKYFAFKEFLEQKLAELNGKTEMGKNITKNKELKGPDPALLPLLERAEKKFFGVGDLKDLAAGKSVIEIAAFVEMVFKKKYLGHKKTNRIDIKSCKAFAAVRYGVDLGSMLNAGKKEDRKPHLELIRKHF